MLVELAPRIIQHLMIDGAFGVAFDDLFPVIFAPLEYVKLKKDLSRAFRGSRRPWMSENLSVPCIFAISTNPSRYRSVSEGSRFSKRAIA